MGFLATLSLLSAPLSGSASSDGHHHHPHCPTPPSLPRPPYLLPTHTHTQWSDRERYLQFDIVCTRLSPALHRVHPPSCRTCETFSHRWPCDLTLPESFAQLAVCRRDWKTMATNAEAYFSEVRRAESVQAHTPSLNNNEFSPGWKLKAAVIDILAPTYGQIVMCNVKGVAWAEPLGINKPILLPPNPPSLPGIFGISIPIALFLLTTSALIYSHELFFPSLQ